MRTFTAVSALALLIAVPTSGAMAADPYSSAKDALPPVLTNQSVWTGFYFGANVGYGWSQLDSSSTLTGTYYDYYSWDSYPYSITLNHTNAASGFSGGGQAGYNFQTGALLLGLEVDFGYLAISQTKNIISASFGSEGFALGTKVDGGFLADVTGRIGYVSGPALLYLKGGWAYLDGTAGTAGINALMIPGIMDVSKSGFDGWTIGGGLEYMVSPNWSIKAEYQHFDFGSFVLHPVLDCPEIAIHNDLTVDTVKVALNYHLGGSSYIPLK